MRQVHINRSFLAGAGALALALAGCGSSSSSSSTSASSSSASTTASHSTASAKPAHPHTIPGVPSPAGALPPAKAKLAKLRPVAKGAGVQAHLGGLGKLPLTQAVQTVSGDINHFWSQEFARSNVQWPAVKDVIVDTAPVQTLCSTTRPTVAPTDSWFLCEGQTDTTFYWTIPWTQQNVATDPGGVNLAFHMAEMWSLRVQFVLGLTDQRDRGTLPKTQFGQQTACLTGIYVRSLNDRKLFEAGDSQSAKSFLQTLNSVLGTGTADVTAQQVQQAFVAGFRSGNPGSCALGGGGGGGGGGSSTLTTTATT